MKHFLFSCCFFSAVGCFLGPSLLAVMCQPLCRSAGWGNADTCGSALRRLPLNRQEVCQKVAWGPGVSAFVDILYFSSFTASVVVWCLRSKPRSSVLPFLCLVLLTATRESWSSCGRLLERNTDAASEQEGLTLCYCCLIHSSIPKVKICSRGGRI